MKYIILVAMVTLVMLAGCEKQSSSKVIITKQQGMQDVQEKVKQESVQQSAESTQSEDATSQDIEDITDDTGTTDFEDITDDVDQSTSTTFEDITDDTVSNTTNTTKIKVINIKDIGFDPTELTVIPGTTIIFKHIDKKGGNLNIIHKVQGLYNAFSSDRMVYGDEFNVTLTEPGEYQYIDVIFKAFMRGTITVTE